MSTPTWPDVAFDVARDCEIFKGDDQVATVPYAVRGETLIDGRKVAAIGTVSEALLAGEGEDLAYEICCMSVREQLGKVA